MLPISVARSSSGIFTIGHITCRREGVFFPIKNALLHHIVQMHHKVQKFSSGTGSPGWSQKKGRKTVVVLCGENALSARKGGDESAQCGRSMLRMIALFVTVNVMSVSSWNHVG